MIIANGITYTHEEYQALQEEERARQKAEGEAQEQAEAAAQARAKELMHNLASTYSEYNHLLDTSPNLTQHLSEPEAREHELYLQLRRNLERADEAPRRRKKEPNGTLLQ